MSYPMQSIDSIQTKSLFTVVEVEVNSRCNKRCSYCPVSVLPIPDVPRYMNNDVFQKLLGELVRINFDGRISYHFYNEPLIRRDLEELIRQVKVKLPIAHQALYTNGDLLSDKRYSSLKEAGIAHFIVTRHDFTPIPERPLQTVLYPTNLQLTNRGGILVELPKVSPQILSLPCYAPSEMLIVTVTGDVVLCYEDAERTQIMGNILESSIEKIWLSEKFVRLRKELADGNRFNGASICRNCTNKVHYIPETSWFAL